MRAHTHLHTKPPSGQGLTLTLKGLCLATVIATPQAGDVSTSTSMPLCVFMSVRVTIMYGVNSCRHPQHAELIVTWVCVHVQCGLFKCEQLRDNGSSTNKAQRRRTIVPFDGVCLWWWGDRK